MAGDCFGKHERAGMARKCFRKRRVGRWLQETLGPDGHRIGIGGGPEAALGGPTT